jgi:2-polyprenyl-3-methyl-5-hydroxy-6-metoxy-1,4-benzoquinol methylase
MTPPLNPSLQFPQDHWRYIALVVRCPGNPSIESLRQVLDWTQALTSKSSAASALLVVDGSAEAHLVSSFDEARDFAIFEPRASETSSPSFFACRWLANHSTKPDIIVELPITSAVTASELKEAVTKLETGGFGLVVVAPKMSVAQQLRSRARLAAMGSAQNLDVDVAYAGARVFRSAAFVTFDDAVPRAADFFEHGVSVFVESLGYGVGAIVSESPRGNETTFDIDLAKAIRAAVRETKTAMRADQTNWAKRHHTFNAQTDSETFEFGNNDALEKLAQASAFNDWIARSLEPAVSGRLLEVGAGSGTMTKLFTENSSVRGVVSIEPADSLYTQLSQVCRELPRATSFHGTSASFLKAQSEPLTPFDSAVYVSVLEHIEDEVSELTTVRALLRPGARIGIFVPAMPSLYGSVDHLSGHFRRYTKEQMVAVCAEAGLNIVSARYFDPISVLPYWLAYRVAKKSSVGEKSGSLFDRVLVPIGRASERVLPNPPRGKNVVVIAEVPHKKQ